MCRGTEGIIIQCAQVCPRDWGFHRNVRLSLNFPLKRFPNALIQELILVYHDLKKKSLKINWSLLFMDLYKNTVSAMCFNFNHWSQTDLGNCPCRSFISFKDKFQKQMYISKKADLGKYFEFQKL